jgi:hypothetical protein
MRLKRGSTKAGIKFLQPAAFDKCIKAFVKNRRLWQQNTDLRPVILLLT